MKFFFESLLAAAICFIPFVLWWILQATERTPHIPNPGVLLLGEQQVICVDARLSPGGGQFDTLDGKTIVVSGAYLYFKRD